jgi:amidophosphoribosyltransferase
MGGFFGVTSRANCIHDLFFGTDYHSHLGTMRGGLASLNSEGFTRYIHDISNTQFRSKFEHDVDKMDGNRGIGVISDFEDQPILVSSHLGMYAIVTVGVIQNSAELTKKAFKRKSTHFSEIARNEVNPTELVATLINFEDTFADGLASVQEQIEGSCSVLLLTEEGLYASRDRLGRTPIVIGRKEGAYAAATESCSFHNLDYALDRFLGPGEIVLMNEDGIEQKKPAETNMQICSFLWVYYGYPASSYEGIGVEDSRYRCGAALARNEDYEIDVVAGIPDSGTAHAIGYAVEAGVPFRRPFVKYTPTWPRSFMPQQQEIRNLVARMKLIPVSDLIDGQRLLFCEDSIVRGTQLRDIVERVFDAGAREVHMRAACPPLVYGCKYLNFSRSRSILDLATRTAMKELGYDESSCSEFADAESGLYAEMVERIRERLKLTSLRYQTLDDLVGAIGLPKEKLCTYCWDGCEGCASS